MEVFMDTDRIKLSSVISSLRGEINKAWQEGQYDAVGFEAGPIEVELTTEIEVVEIKGKISAKFWVLDAEAESGRTKTSTQRIAFSLTPKDRRDPSKPLLIAGNATTGERRPALSMDEGRSHPRPNQSPVG